jgi:hypothetical protein
MYRPSLPDAPTMQTFIGRVERSPAAPDDLDPVVV